MQTIPPNRFEIQKKCSCFFFSKFLFLMVPVGTSNLHGKKSLFGIFRIIVQGQGKIDIKVIRLVENFPTKNLTYYTYGFDVPNPPPPQVEIYNWLGTAPVPPKDFWYWRFAGVIPDSKQLKMNFVYFQYFNNK